MVPLSIVIYWIIYYYLSTIHSLTDKIIIIIMKHTNAQNAHHRCTAFCKYQITIIPPNVPFGNVHSDSD